MDVLKAIETRRSIRKYRPDPVDNETVERVLEAARWAPSWANTQCWRFIVVRDIDIKNKLADTLIGVTGKAGQSLQVGPNGEPMAPMKGVSQRPNRAAEAIRDAPVAIVACAELAKSGFYTKDPGEAVTDKGDWFMFDVALAMQNLTLAAHSLGLGTVHVGAFDARKVADLLAVPKGFAVVEMTPLGYPDEQPAARKRKELAEIISYEKFTIS
jgi:nitroreductase